MRIASLVATFVLLSNLATFSQSTDVVVPADRVVESVGVRDEAVAGSEIIGRLRKNESAELLVSLPNWYRIRLSDGTEGFVPKAWTRRTTLQATLPGGAGATNDVAFKVHFLDVGTGDAAIIDMGDREILIDGGNSPTILKRYLDERQIIDGPIELVIVTHGDTDHWKGLRRLLNFDNQAPNPPKVSEFWEPGYDRDCNGPNNSGRESYLAFIKQARNLPGVRFVRPLETTHPPAVETGTLQPFSLQSLPGVTFTVLHSAEAPASDNNECSYLINNASIVVKIQIGQTTMLFTGDANGKERDEEDATEVGHVEAQLLALEKQVPGALKVDILKVPHHGSETASTTPFIQKTNPHFVIISGSTMHHLPKDAVVHRYEGTNRVILRTDDNHVSDEDHILCIKTPGQALDCNYESVLVEG